MNRVPLADELPYQFVAPKLNPACLWFGRLTGRRMLRKDHKIESLDVSGLKRSAR